MTATLDYREASMEDLKARAAELRAGITELGVRAAGEGVDWDSPEGRALVAEVTAVDAFIGLGLRGEQESVIAALRELADNGGAGPAAATAEVGTEGIRSGGLQVIESDGVREWVDRGMPSKLPTGSEYIVIEIDGGISSFGLRALTEFTGSGPGNLTANSVGSLLPVGQPIAPVPRQAPLFMRDLMPVVPTTLAVVPYVRELAPTSLEGGASAVAETNVKPDVGVNFTPATASVTVIAGNVSPSKQLWQDAPLVVAYINQRLPYLVKYREDAEFLNGSGAWPDIAGIINTVNPVTGLQSQGATSGESAITLGNSIAKVENVDLSASAVVMNPLDAWAMYTKRAAGGSGTFDAGTPFSDIPMTVWGLPVKRTRVMASGTALVGDFARGGMVVDREQVNVQVYPQHSDYAARDQILVQAEERVGVLWLRPDGFVKTTIA